FDTVHFDYRNAQREAGETKWKFGALLNYAMDGLISFNNRPLRLGIWLGTSLVALTGLYALWITVMAMTYGVDSPELLTSRSGWSAAASVDQMSRKISICAPIEFRRSARSS
ncbi:hypothetical protein ACFVZZ_46625, partial [Streptomyces chartreusis]